MKNEKTLGAKMLEYSFDPYAEEDTLLNDWIEERLKRVRYNLFKHQHDWLYMMGELGEGSIPKFKKNAVSAIQDAVYNEFGWLANYMTDRLIAEFRLANIDLNEELIEEMKYNMGGYEDENDTTYDEWEAEARERIFKEYEKNLGREKTLELAKNWWGENFSPDLED